MDNKRLNDEMISVVNSSQAKEVYEKTIKNTNSKALTSEGIIQSYEIDYKSIEHNPMGGIMLKLVINNDASLYILVTLRKDSNNKLEKTGGGVSAKLVELLDKEKTK